MAAPLYRVTIKNKDGKPFTFKDYKGETVTKEYRPIGAVFQGKYGLNLVLEKRVGSVTLTEDMYINLDAPKPRGGQRNDEGSGEMPF